MTLNDLTVNIDHLSRDTPRRDVLAEAAHEQKRAPGDRGRAVVADQDVTSYSTVTDLARLRGWSTLQPRFTAM
jgi:hypothetical protein